MLDERLSNIAVQSVHSRRAKVLDLEAVDDKFVLRYLSCRIQLT